MDITRMSESLLREFHSSIRRCLESDDSLDDNDKENAQNFRDPRSYYGVRKFADWKELKDQIEEELTSRNISFQRIEKFLTVQG